MNGLVCDVFNDVTDAVEWLFMHTPLGYAIKYILNFFKNKSLDKGGVQYLPQWPEYQEELEAQEVNIQDVWEELMGTEWDSPTASMAVKYPPNPFPNDYMQKWFVFPKVVVACANGQVMYVHRPFPREAPGSPPPGPRVPPPGPCDPPPPPHTHTHTPGLWTWPWERWTHGGWPAWGPV